MDFPRAWAENKALRRLATLSECIIAWQGGGSQEFTLYATYQLQSLSTKIFFHAQNNFLGMLTQKGIFLHFRPI
jgi:hypothetical protein